MVSAYTDRHSRLSRPSSRLIGAVARVLRRSSAQVSSAIVLIPGMRRFEYMALDCASLDDLNRHGAEGWEYIGDVRLLVADDTDAKTQSEQPSLLFKRVTDD